MSWASPREVVRYWSREYARRVCASIAQAFAGFAVRAAAANATDFPEAVRGVCRECGEVVDACTECPIFAGDHRAGKGSFCPGSHAAFRLENRVEP